MKSTNTTLINFLENALTYVRADLYQFTLSGGSILNYCSVSTPITYTPVSTAYTYNVGPPIQDAGVQSSRGMNSSSVDITILGGNGLWTVNGVDIIDFLDGFGLDGAVGRIDRVFAADWPTMYSTGPVGGYQRFGGFIGEIKELGETQAVVNMTSWMDLLQTPFPPETFGTSCLNVFGDSNCGVTVPSTTGTVSTSSVTPTTNTFGSGLTQAANYFTLGTCTFTSGANSGISRSIKAYSNTYGQVTVTAPFPSPPASGDAFTVTPGCLLSRAACTSNQSLGSPAPTHPWYERYRATPFVPPPTIGLPT